MKRFATFILLLTALTTVSMAQFQYKFTNAGTQAYTPLTGSNQFVWTGTNDEGYTAAVAIGFPFTYDGVAQDSFQVSTNGFLRFGFGHTSASLSNALNGTVRGVLAPFWDDMAAADSSTITYQAVGSSPNRELWVEWKAIKAPYNNSVANLNFQVVLFENGNKIQFRYGGMAAPDSAKSATASIGLSNTLALLTANQGTGTFLSINLADSVFAGNVHQSMGSEFNGINSLPDSGRVFEFTAVSGNAPLSGVYTVGLAGSDFQTLSEAAMTLNRNGISGAVTLNIEAGTYNDVFHLIHVAGTSATNTITVKPAGAAGSVTLSPLRGSFSTTAPNATTGDAMIRLEGTQYVTIDGLNLVDNLGNLTTRTKFNMGVLMRNAVFPVSGVASFVGARYNTIKNVTIDMNAINGAPNVGAMGVRIGTQGTNTTDTASSNSYNTIQNCIIEDYWRAGIFMYGFQGVLNPDRGNRIIGVDGGFTEIRNAAITAGASNDVRSIEMNAQYGLFIENVKITNVKSSVNTTNSVYGIRFNPANSSTDHISGNIVLRNVYIDGIWNEGTTTTSGLAVGIDIQRLGDGSTLLLDKVVVKDIYSNASTTGRAFGIQLNNGGSTTISNSVRIQNSYVYDLRAPRSTASGTSTGPAVQGMNLQAVSGLVNYELYYNTVLLDSNATPAGAATHSTNLFWGNFGNGTLDLRNNVLVNMTKSGTGRNSVLFGSTGTNFLKLAATTNNNLLYADTAQVLDVIGYNGAADYVTLADYKTYVSPRDTFAVTEIVPFMSYAAPVNPRINTSSPTLVDNGGAPIAGITTDYYGTSRNANTPDIGAEELIFRIIGWANLQWPPQATVLQGRNATVYGQIWIDGVTNLPGPGDSISAWVGYSTTNDDPSGWTNWVPAVFNTDAGNNDEYMAGIGASLAPGTYYYATRYQYYGGAFYYGGYNQGGGGQWNGTTNVSGVLTVEAPLFINWERSAANTTIPAWFSTSGHTERGFAWGNAMLPGGTLAGRIFVPSRNTGTYIKVLDDSTGADLGDLDINGISGGTFAVNDAEVDYLGHIYAANLTTSTATSAFKVYRWKNTGSTPEVAINYIGDAVRLGDKISVEFDSASNASALWAASATTGQHKVYKWTKIAGTDSFNQTPTVISLSDALTTGIGSAAVAPLFNGDFYWNAGGQSVRKYSANGTLIGIVPGTVVATGSNAIKFVGTLNGSEFFATFQHGAGNENARVVEVPNGDPTLAITYGVSPALGANANPNGTGDVAVKRNADGSSTIFVMGTNNGVGSYRTARNIPVEFTSFTAKSQDRNVVLSWTTATETNSASFEVERTVLGSANWSAVGSVRAAGTTTDEQIYTFVDRNLNTAKYQYRLKQIDLDGTFQYSSVVEVEVGLPMTFGLSQNYPNPFNPTTKIQYQVPADARVTLELFDATGQRVASLVSTELTAGYYAFDLSAGSYGLASGIYFYRMIAVESGSGKNFVETKKMVMLK